mgnify:CR=1 FL=1
MSKDFQLEAKYSPAGDQPEAIERLVEGLDDGEAGMTLLGVTGSGRQIAALHLGALPAPVGFGPLHPRGGEPDRADQQATGPDRILKHMREFGETEYRDELEVSVS